jgi:RNA polymerase sigma-70 factor, ECF subfamily
LCEALIPQLAIALEPFVQLAERLGAQLIQALLGARLDIHQSGLFQDAQVLRHVRLVEPQPVADLVHRAGTGTQQLDDTKAIGLGQGGEGLDHGMQYAKLGICLSRHFWRCHTRTLPGVFVSENNHVTQTATSTAAFESRRSRLFGLAYRMLGSRAEAEDIVQETYVRWHQAAIGTIENPEAWLVTTATRLAIDRLRRLKTERDAYVGPWLPEPIVSVPAPDRDLDLADDLSIAFLTLLERLAPEERAAFLLHDVFDVGYESIAAVLERTEAACRQVVHRARERVRGERKRFDVSESAKAALLHKFLAAMEARDEQALLQLFAPDASWTADGGGRVGAAPRPIVGAALIAKLVIGLREKFWAHDRTVEVTAINGETGLSIRDGGRLTATMSIVTDGERILDVYAVVNPDKLS